METPTLQPNAPTLDNHVFFALAHAVLNGDALLARSLAQDLYRHPVQLAQVPPPADTDPRMLALTAGLLELFAARLNQPSPEWTKLVGRLPQPIYLVQAALYQTLHQD